MEKKRLTKILANAERRDISALSADIWRSYRPVIVKEPEKTLTMVKMREPVRQSLFYIGEVIVCEAVVEIDGVQGIAVVMGDDADRTLNMAIIDAAINKGVFTGMDTLFELERKQNERLMKENAMHMSTMVNFESMDQEAPNDLSSYKKA
jgi:alpha-D-ribose 1-methylphosphonate 5-triphosphate synthase subunit PhnG